MRVVARVSNLIRRLLGYYSDRSAWKSCKMNGWEAGTRTPIRRSRVYSKRQKRQQIKEFALQTAEESGRIRKTAAVRMTVQLRRPLCPERPRSQCRFCREYQADLPRDNLRAVLFSGLSFTGYLSGFSSGKIVGSRRIAVYSACLEYDSAHNLKGGAGAAPVL